MKTRAIVLFAHGARDPRWAEPFNKITERLQSVLIDEEVRLCFLELMKPSLTDTVADIAYLGFKEITIVPLFMAQGGHLREDLPKILAQLREHHPEVKFHQTSAIGDAPELLDAIAQWVINTTRS
ncbi:CbiX/SirB N-terminal domain-containing protein [Ferrovum sp. PN-J185]|uniref:sirohydrochlorin chelatase n=1 Tax=Ferrovum sp. PN-J185 TaxID=1356306 RepID=UPI00079B9BFC|nr:CbiX/SirB N-terminal domain-containing protein [Ferrovum sp. PN-J185]KXW56404.1 sirohydrochlorin cobaltochelatase [Ferrovum sp. PN-J185]MCC6069127.1 CbiX/SirB N-terminal domain-containing protein [Ferrovum sp. PN-J185]MDE1890892.1 CbiX/SirB N-terminal domain-containing protein [Betaproteobacteria bacterium]MDE2055796.1 CbiX/SirB N-terminal domain-containing protein [Betaproteobacteria bacterium]